MANQELLATIRDRCRASSKREKSRILDPRVRQRLLAASAATLGEGGDGGERVASGFPGGLPFGQGVPPFGDGGAVGGRHCSCLNQADGRVRSQTDVPALSLDYNSLDPGLGTRRSNVQIKTVAVAMPAGPADSLDGERSELSHLATIPIYFPTRCVGFAGILRRPTASCGMVEGANIIDPDTSVA